MAKGEPPGSPAPASEPGPDANHETQMRNVPARRAFEASRIAESLIIFHADVRREFLDNLVAQSEPDLRF